jgi:hypothetical protein
MTMPAIIIWSIALLISLVGLVVSVNSQRFASAVATDARALWVTASSSPPPRAIDLLALPDPVRRYLRQAGVERRTALRSVRVRHQGSMTLAPGAKPVPVRGRQYFAADPPGFVWWGRVRVAPGVWIDARDKVIDGQGGMKVVLESTKTLQDVTGPTLDQGALTRLLGELVWMPTALVDDRYVTWEAIDESRARARLRVNGTQVMAVFHFGPDGLPLRFTADRYRDLGNGQSALTPFVGTLGDWREVDGLRVPFAVEASWILDGKPFTFARFQVDAVELDRPAPFRS